MTKRIYKAICAAALGVFVVTMLAQWMTMDSNPSGIAKNVFNEAISERFPSTISTSYSAFMIICNSDGSSAVYP